MSALPLEQHQPVEFTCAGPSGPCEPLHCEVCSLVLCGHTEHWSDPDAASLCFGEDYWHGRVVHDACHTDCPHPECHDSDQDVLEAYRERDYD